MNSKLEKKETARLAEKFGIKEELVKVNLYNEEGCEDKYYMTRFKIGEFSFDGQGNIKDYEAGEPRTYAYRLSEDDLVKLSTALGVKGG